MVEKRLLLVADEETEAFSYIVYCLHFQAKGWNRHSSSSQVISSSFPLHFMMIFIDFMGFLLDLQNTYWVRTEYVQKWNPYKGRKLPEKGCKNPNGRTYSMRILMDFGGLNFNHVSTHFSMFQLMFLFTCAPLGSPAGHFLQARVYPAQAA